MGEPDEVWEKRIKELSPYKVTKEVMANAKDSAIFLHCLPAFHDLKTKIGAAMYEKFGVKDMEEQLCEKFGVSRTAVWKVIRQLQEEGYEVEAVRNKGIPDHRQPGCDDEGRTGKPDGYKVGGKNIVYYDEIDSTNLRIKQLGDEGAVEGTLAVADRQTAGRGRRGRSWDSPAGESISMSILLRPQITRTRPPC